MMDWSNESYVRLYTRDTKTWLKLGWEGQAVFALASRKADRAGVFDDIRDAADLAVVFANGIPIEVVAVGLKRLLDLGVMVVTEKGLLIPNFIEAQEAKKSDPQRQREARERRRLESRNVTVESRNVTEMNGIRSLESQPVTGCHDLSRPVTLPSALPCSAVLIQPAEGELPIQCPPDLKLTDSQISALQMNNGIKPWQIDTMTADFVSRCTAGGQPRTLTNWRKTLAKAITSDWNAGKRPRQEPRPEPQAPKGKPGQALHPDGYWYYPLSAETAQ